MAHVPQKHLLREDFVCIICLQSPLNSPRVCPTSGGCKCLFCIKCFPNYFRADQGSCPTCRGMTQRAEWTAHSVEYDRTLQIKIQRVREEIEEDYNNPEEVTQFKPFSLSTLTLLLFQVFEFDQLTDFEVSILYQNKFNEDSRNMLKMRMSAQSEVKLGEEARMRIAARKPIQQSAATAGVQTVASVVSRGCKVGIKEVSASSSRAASGAAAIVVAFGEVAWHFWRWNNGKITDKELWRHTTKAIGGGAAGFAGGEAGVAGGVALGTACGFPVIGFFAGLIIGTAAGHFAMKQFLECVLESPEKAQAMAVLDAFGTFHLKPNSLDDPPKFQRVFDTFKARIRMVHPDRHRQFDDRAQKDAQARQYILAFEVLKKFYEKHRERTRQNFQIPATSAIYVMKE